MFDMLQATVKTIWCFTYGIVTQFRVNFTFPFSRTGVDFMGPLFVRNIFYNNNLYKVFIVVYTCASSRAILLDIVPDASCSSSVLLQFKTVYFCK